MNVDCRTQNRNLFSNHMPKPQFHVNRESLIKTMQKKFKENISTRKSFRKQLEIKRIEENLAAKVHPMKARVESTETRTRTSVIKKLFWNIGGYRKNYRKEIADTKQLQLIWQKKDITRMRDSGIFQQMERMRTYAEAESRSIVHKRSQLDCEQLDRLESNDRKLAQSQLTNLYAKADKESAESSKNIESREGTLENDSNERRKLQKSENEHSLLVGNCQGYEESKCLNVLIVEKKPKQQPKAVCTKESVTELLYLRHVVEPEDDFDQVEAEKQALLQTIENLMPKTQGKNVKKSTNLPKKWRKQHQKTKEKCKKPNSHKKAKCLRVIVGKLNTAHTKKKWLDTQTFDNSLFTRMRSSSERPLNGKNCATVKAKAKAKVKLNRAANVKVPKSKCKHYRRENLCAKRKAKRRKTLPPAGETHKLSRRTKKILNQRQQCSTNVSMKILEKPQNTKVPSKPESSSCSVSTDWLNADTATTSKATAKVAHSENGNKTQPAFSSYASELLSEPSTSSLEQMLVHITAELKKRNTSKLSISNKLNACTAHKIVKKATNAGKCNNKLALQGALTRNKVKGGNKPPKSSTAIISIPLMQNPKFILGQQNGRVPMAYTTGKRASVPALKKRVKSLKIGSFVAQESEA
uniref:Uncharacterized protein n=1 Tax=Ceratitis capitata TaxID=7213 RepID=W8B3T7_CERCA